IEDTLQHPLIAPDDAIFTLRDIPMEDRQSEQEFNFSSKTAVETVAGLKSILLEHWKGEEDKQEFVNALNNWGENEKIPHGYLTGFMDLVFRHNGYFYVIDWKSNSLDGKIERFNDVGIREEMAKHGYFFQYMLYAAVLHSYLKSRLGARYSWEQNFGGVRYYFLRGITAGGAATVFEDRPSEALLDEFSKKLGMEVK
ncbi:MAG: PD-(D/E)XK nuclease family protein, partial [Victivallales bacterium]|nr:PD-(D/E)XK nuclease family protein [Victivallales bacterium]